MVNKFLAKVAAGGLAAAAIAGLTVAPANADPYGCVDAWNDGYNSDGQANLVAVFADGGLGNVVVGLEGDDCVLAAYNTNRSRYVVYRQWDYDFVRVVGGPGDQFGEYLASIDYVDVILQVPSGTVTPV